MNNINNNNNRSSISSFNNNNLQSQKLPSINLLINQNNSNNNFYLQLPPLNEEFSLKQKKNGLSFPGSQIIENKEINLININECSSPSSSTSTPKFSINYENFENLEFNNNEISSDEYNNYYINNNIVVDDNVEVEVSEIQFGKPSAIFRCKWVKCLMVFQNLNDLGKHVKEQHVDSQKNYKKCICDWEECPRKNDFFKKGNLIDHIRHNHTGEKPFKCDINGCRFKSSSQGNLYTHKKDVHKFTKYIYNIKDKNGNNKKEVLDNSGHFETIWDGNNNNTLNQPNGEFKCFWKNCICIFNSLDELEDHIEDFHVIIQKLENNVNQFQCLWKGCCKEKRIFTSKKTMLNHIFLYHSNKDYSKNYKVEKKKITQKNKLKFNQLNNNTIDHNNLELINQY